MKTIYIKVLGEDGVAAYVEVLNDPVYVRQQESNGRVVRCIEPIAQGILDAKEETVYQLHGKEELACAVATAMVITMAEYDELVATMGSTEEDTEDTDPVIPEGEGEPMTRAQLTEAVTQLNAEMTDLVAAIEKGLSL